MPSRDVTITELHAAGPEGRKLLSLAEFARVSYQTEEQGGRHFVRFGGPYTFKVHPSPHVDVEPCGTGDDLGSALKDLFSQIARSTLLLESAPPAGERGVKTLFRYKENRFQV